MTDSLDSCSWDVDSCNSSCCLSVLPCCQGFMLTKRYRTGTCQPTGMSCAASHNAYGTLETSTLAEGMQLSPTLSHKYIHKHLAEVVVSSIERGWETWIRINMYVAECSLNYRVLKNFRLSNNVFCKKAKCRTRKWFLQVTLFCVLSCTFAKSTFLVFQRKTDLLIQDFWKPSPSTTVLEEGKGGGRKTFKKLDDVLNDYRLSFLACIPFSFPAGFICFPERRMGQ